MQGGQENSTAFRDLVAELGALDGRITAAEPPLDDQRDRTR